MTTTIGPDRWRPVRWGVIAMVLLLPLIATRFTDEMAWTGFDFAVAAALLVGAGALYEVAAARIGDSRRRTMAGAAILAAVLLVWAEGAVGLFT